MSQAKQLIQAIATRLESITTANGYNTNAGNQVYLGMTVVDAELSTFPLLNVLFDSEEAESLTWHSYRNELQVDIDAYLTDNTAATTLILDLLTDINQAIEQPDETIGGLAHSTDYIGAQQMETFDNGRGQVLRVSYNVTYDRDYGA